MASKENPLSHTPILIVGAGPTGLMMACQLARFGVPFRIIEKNLCPTDKSKALAVQARTLEIYDQMGIAQTAVEQGQVAENVQLIIRGKRSQKVHLGHIGKNLSPFPYMLLLEQSKNERILVDYLKSRKIWVEWGKEFVNFTEQEKFNKVYIKNKEGKEEILYADWIVAADGAKSPIRHKLEIPFEGGTYQNIFYVVDCAVEWEFGEGELNLYLGAKSFIAFFPMKGKNRFRVLGILPDAFKEEKDVKFEDIQQHVQNQMEIPVSFSDVRWFSVYKLHHRNIKNFQAGRVFFAGDAAHVHSPAGGQGMNTGLQDAYNLAWKLALVVKKQASSQLLRTYNEERLPIAKNLVKTTDRVFSLIIRQDFWVKLIKFVVLPIFAPILLKFEKIKQAAFSRLSQTLIHYQEQSLAATESEYDLKSADIFAGDRVPYLKVKAANMTEAISIYKLLESPKFTIFILGKTEKEALDLKERIFLVVQEIQFQVHHLPLNPENEPLLKRLGVKNQAIMLIRPDNYIAYLNTNTRLSEVWEYLKNKMFFDIKD